MTSDRTERSLRARAHELSVDADAGVTMHLYFQENMVARHVSVILFSTRSHDFIDVLSRIA
jgi:hypothetical protein